MTTQRDDTTDQATFPMRVAARLSGVTPERMRAWESRHGAVRPQRSEGGTRRYTHLDLDRLKLLREVVDAGHRIGDVAGFDLAQLRRCLSERAPVAGERYSEILGPIRGLDGVEVLRLLREQMAERGPLDFARNFVLGLAVEIGRLWETNQLSIAAEHLATSIMRSLLVNALATPVADASGPVMVFATPSSERHDLGALVAALMAREAGARPVFLGADVPESELIDSVRSSSAEVLALGFVMSPRTQVEAQMHSIRRALPDSVALWVGGSAIKGCAPVRGVDRIENLDQLAAFVLDVNSSATWAP